MSQEFTSVEEQVEYGLGAIDANRTVQVSLRDLLYVYQTIGEFVRFFHQRMHYPDLEAVHKFRGDPNAGGHHLLSECCYEKLYAVWPEDIKQEFDEGRFDNPKFPYYYQSPTEIAED